MTLFTISETYIQTAIEMKFSQDTYRYLFDILTCIQCEDKKKILPEENKCHVLMIYFGQFVDPEHGEWFGYLSQEGKVTHYFKGGPFKGETLSTRPCPPNSFCCFHH